MYFKMRMVFGVTLFLCMTDIFIFPYMFQPEFKQAVVKFNELGGRVAQGTFLWYALHFSIR